MPLRQRYLFVCSNRRPPDAPKGSCAASGSESVHAALKSELATRKLAVLEARACTSSCLDVCSQAPVILVEPDHIFLGNVTVADIPAVVDGLQSGTFPEHLVLSKDVVDKG